MTRHRRRTLHRTAPVSVHYSRGGLLNLAVGALLIAAGCAGDDGPVLTAVSGEVLYQGKPLAGAVVQFHVSGAPIIAAGKTDEQGKFTLSSYGKGDGAPVGDCRVTISKPIDSPTEEQVAANLEELQSIQDPTERRMRSAAMLKDRVARAQAVQRLQRKLSPIPVKYMDPETSGLTALVREGEENFFRFELE